MITLTKEWLLKTIAELEEERDATPGAVNEDAAMALAAMKLALASLEAEHAGFIVKHKVTGKFGSWLHSKADWFRSDEYEVLSAYIAPPAPVSVPDNSAITQHFDTIALETAREIMCDVNRRHEFLGGDVQLLSRIQCRIDDACRAAMLQGADGNSPAHSGCRPAQNCISPAIPDGWVMVPEEPTHEMLEAGDEQFGTYDVYRRMIAASPQQK